MSKEASSFASSLPTAGPNRDWYSSIDTDKIGSNERCATYYEIAYPSRYLQFLSWKSVIMLLYSLNLSMYVDYCIPGI